jgi:hypothetical protein
MNARCHVRSTGIKSERKIPDSIFPTTRKYFLDVRKLSCYFIANSHLGEMLPRMALDLSSVVVRQ